MTDTTLTRRQMVGLLGACSLALAATGCAGGEKGGETAVPVSDDAAVLEDAQASAGGNSITMGVSIDPDGLDPHRTAATATFQITTNVFDTLLGVTEDGRLVPRLAQDWTVADDGLSITFTLHEGVTFSNGAPCDATACAASFARLLDASSPRVSQYEGYTFEAADERTLVVRMETLNVAAPTDFAYAWSAVVDPASVDEGRWPVGTGPYTVVEWTPQERVVLQANPSYWGDAPALEEVVFSILPDATSKTTSLRAHRVDLIEAPSEQVASFEGDDAFKLIQAPQNGVQLMAMNCANEALADVRVRRAIVMAIDRSALIETVWWGLGEAIGSHFPTMINGYVDCTDVVPYDPQGAEQLLAEAGWGQGLTLRMRLPKDYQMYVDAGQVIADMLGKVGVTCQIEIVEWATWLEEVYSGRDYDLTVVGHTGRLDPITLLARYESTSSENYFNYASDEVDGLIAQYRGELDDETRLEIVRRIQLALAQDVPAFYIQDPITTYIADSAVEGFVMYPIDIYEFKDVSLAG